MVAAASAARKLQLTPVIGSTMAGSAADYAIFQPAIGTITSDGTTGTNVSSAMPTATPT